MDYRQQLKQIISEYKHYKLDELSALEKFVEDLPTSTHSNGKNALKNKKSKYSLFNKTKATAIRRKLGLSQRGLADKIGIHPTLISNYESHGTTKKTKQAISYFNFLKKNGY